MTSDKPSNSAGSGKAIEKSAANRRMIRQRLVIEARISLGNRKFGWNRCRARIVEHETSWIGLGAAAMQKRYSPGPNPNVS